MWNMGMGWGGGWGGFGMLTMILWWVLLAAAIVVLAKWLIGSDRTSGDRSLAVLNERYARGEIGKDEYEQKKRDLAA